MLHQSPRKMLCLLLPARPDPRGLGVSAGFPGKGEKGQSAQVWDSESAKKQSGLIWRKCRDLGSSAGGSLGNPAPISLKTQHVFMQTWFYAKFFWGNFSLVFLLYIKLQIETQPSPTQNEQYNTFTGLQSYLLFAFLFYPHSTLKTNAVLLQGLHLEQQQRKIPNKSKYFKLWSPIRKSLWHEVFLHILTDVFPKVHLD